MLKKLLVLSLAFVMGIGMFFGVGSSTSAETNSLQPELNVNSFDTYLQQESEVNSEAKEILEKFKALTNEQKKQFIQYMQDPEVFKALMKQSTLNNELTTELYGGDVTTVNTITVENVEPARSQQSLAVTSSRKATYTVTQYIFGIPLTKLSSWVRYTHNGSKVLSAYGNGAAARNFNIAVSISESVSRPWKTSTRAYSETIWHGYAVYKGFGIRMDKEQQVWGNIYNQAGGYLVNI